MVVGWRGWIGRVLERDPHRRGVRFAVLFPAVPTWVVRVVSSVAAGESKWRRRVSLPQAEQESCRGDVPCVRVKRFVACIRALPTSLLSGLIPCGRVSHDTVGVFRFLGGTHRIDKQLSLVQVRLPWYRSLLRFVSDRWWW